MAKKKKKDKFLKECEEKLKLKFKKSDLLRTSLTHKSYANENREAGEKDNERLEFLGDSVLSLIISQHLMECYPEMDEGEYSKKRSSIVNERTLAKLSRKIDLGKFLRLGKGEELTGGRDKDSILADAMEALIGAIYLDSGLKVAQKFIVKHFKSSIQYSAKPQSNSDYKTLVQEMAQKLFKKTPSYKVVKLKGPEHDRIFESEIFIDDKSFGKGKGKSKKDSEQKCAKVAIKKMGNSIEEL